MYSGIGVTDDGNGTTYSSATTSFVDPNPNWHFIALVYNGTHGNLYLDGTFKVKTGEVTGGLRDSTNDLVIGNLGGTRPWNGSIDELIIYNHSLSSEQILALYQNKTNLIL